MHPAAFRPIPGPVLQRSNIERMKNTSLQKLLAVGATVAALPCFGADHLPNYNLHPTFPTDLVDAYPLEYQTLSTFAIVRYERTANDRDSWLLQPEARYGFAPQWEADIAVPFLEGNYKGTGGGNIRVGALYQFLEDSDWYPAMAVGPQAELPTGRASRGVDIGFTLAASKSLANYIPDARGDEIHANFGWTYNMEARDNERDNYFQWRVGYSREIYEDLVGVADFIHQQSILKRHDENIIEAGVIYTWTRNLAVAGGIGFGLGAESPDIRLTAGVQYTF
jgi:hypothetical protein